MILSTDIMFGAPFRKLAWDMIKFIRNDIIVGKFVFVERGNMFRIFRITSKKHSYKVT